MIVNRKALLSTILFSLILTNGMVFASLLNINFGTVDIESISIAHDEIQLSGLLYKPKSASLLTPQPAIVLTHGIGSCKEYMSGIALELGRRDIISLIVDEIGHGNSGGFFGFSSDPTLGILSAVKYLESKSFVNSSSIGLIGHSLGAGAVRATSAIHGNITATVLIGGGIGDMAEGLAYGEINESFPRNLLIAVGNQDILFDIPSLKYNLAPVFNTSESVEPNILYGSFSSNTARKLVLTPTIHLAETFDPYIVTEIVKWMELALKPPSQGQLSPSNSIFLIRDFTLICSFIMFIGFLCSISALMYDIFEISEKQEQIKNQRTFHKNWRILILWSCLGAILFLPVVVFGFLIPFPPLLFGTSIVWWLFIWGLLGVVLIKILLPKFTEIVPDIRDKVKNSLKKQEIPIIVFLIVIIYFTSISLKIIFKLNFQILTPLFGDLLPIPRLFIFFVFIPFLFINFSVDGLLFYEYYDQRESEEVKSKILQFLRILGIKIVPFIIILLIIYAPLFLLDLKLIPGFLGLIIEFLFGIIPIIFISSIFTDWFYQLTRSFGVGALFNSIIIAWIIADTFALGGFF